MKIFARMTRLLRADLHGLLDRLEDKELMLKQCLRDMEAALLQKEARLKDLVSAQDQSRKSREECCRRLEKIEQDIDLALTKDQDDIARFLIGKLKPLTRHREALNAGIEELDREVEALRKALNDQKRQYEEMDLKVQQHLRSIPAWDVSDSGAGIPVEASSGPSDLEVELELLARKEKIKAGRQEVSHD